jgi:hypothetical protein
MFGPGRRSKEKRGKAVTRVPAKQHENAIALKEISKTLIAGADHLEKTWS